MHFTVVCVVAVLLVAVDAAGSSSLYASLQLPACVRQPAVHSVLSMSIDVHAIKARWRHPEVLKLHLHPVHDLLSLHKSSPAAARQGRGQ
jgi:hypothetical protein